MSDVVGALSSQAAPKVLSPPPAVPKTTPPSAELHQNVSHPLEQLLELVSRNRGPDSLGESPALDDEFVMKYINSIASSYAISERAKEPSPSYQKNSKFDFSVLLPKKEFRDHPIDHLWFSNKGQCYGIDRSMEDGTRPSPPHSPQSDISPPLTPPSPDLSEIKPETRTQCEDLKLLPFDLESYQDLTSPISDLTYTVVPFATSAKVLDLSSGSLRPKELQVSSIKLLDIWDVLGWFALDYLLSAETLAEERNKHLLSFGTDLLVLPSNV